MANIPSDPASVTPEWLSQALGAEVTQCKLEQIGVGVGLLGRLFRAHLEGAPELPATVVVKMPTLDVSVRTRLCEAGDLYLREVRFYREVGAANPLPPAHLYFAALDEATHDFVLVIEDLGGLRNVDQTVGCTADDAATVIDALARHHAYWQNDKRLAKLDWLTSANVPPLFDVVADNYKAALPKFLQRLGSDMSPEILDFAQRFPSRMQWYLDEIARPPHTFLHGDLRLDQLFFGTGPNDPPLRALDWQISTRGRGAYDVGYFLSQSLRPDVRRTCETELLERYHARLAEYGIDYPLEELRRDYRITATWCFCYPVLAGGQADVIANDRHLQLLRTMLDGAVAAIQDHDGLALGPN
jgi:hypothetical protein